MSDEQEWRAAVIADFKTMHNKIKMSAGFNVVTFLMALTALALVVFQWWQVWK